MSHVFERLLNRRKSKLVAALAAAVAVVLVWPGLLQYVQTGHVTIHWSRPVAAVFMLQVALASLIHAVMRRIVDLWKSDLAHASRHEPEDDEVPMAADVATVE